MAPIGKIICLHCPTKSSESDDIYHADFTLFGLSATPWLNRLTDWSLIALYNAGTTNFEFRNAKDNMSAIDQPDRRLLSRHQYSICPVRNPMT